MIFCRHSRLRDAVAEHIPEELRNREKMGFEMPFTDWMTGDCAIRSRRCLRARGGAEPVLAPVSGDVAKVPARWAAAERALAAFGHALELDGPPRSRAGLA